ncbi:thermonuclease family protein [Microbispora sp. RL4-1S]|uniref:Thermonuclease family protein n=1 Tax=Microbispora oryzae TaxID=2806554 RepID=A0A940WMI4_9ACTN|nr:thermonuclease family protein [Microbispora oryzae]MBP2708380.1 thermonuclease family protein [Microbispora oryzae]
MRVLAALTASAVLLAPLAAAVPASAATRPATVPKEAVEVKVKKILDGDGFDVVTAKGATVRVGLLEADAPEQGYCWYDEAVARLKKLLPEGKPVYVLPQKEAVVQDDRILVYVWTGQGSYVNGDMVRNGVAQAVSYYPEHAYTDWQFNEQLKAQLEHRGMWSGPCWALDTFDKRDTLVTPPGAVDTALSPAPVEPEVPSDASDATEWNSQPVPTTTATPATPDTDPGTDTGNDTGTDTNTDTGADTQAALLR